MNYLFMKLTVWILRLIYLPFKRLPTAQKISFISRQSNAPSLNITLLADYLAQQYPQYTVTILTRKLEPGVRKKIKYAVHMLRQMYEITTSKVVVIDGYNIVVSTLSHKADTKTIQMWHSLGAVKQFGWQTIDKPSGHSRKTAEIMCMHSNYDYVICPATATANFYCQAFNVAGDRLYPLGLPRIDYLFDDPEITDRKILKQYPSLKEKPTVLYIPTFRKGRPIKIDSLADAIDPNRYQLIVKLHPLDQFSPHHLDHVITDHHFHSYDWIKFCDHIITDYSALSIDASLLRKPVYFYLYDWEQYQNDPGLNIKFQEEEIRNYVFENPRELADALAAPYNYDALEQFSSKYMNTRPKQSYTADFAQFIVSLMVNSSGEEWRK